MTDTEIQTDPDNECEDQKKEYLIKIDFLDEEIMKLKNDMKRDKYAR